MYFRRSLSILIISLFIVQQSHAMDRRRNELFSPFARNVFVAAAVTSILGLSYFFEYYWGGSNTPNSPSSTNLADIVDEGPEVYTGDDVKASGENFNKENENE